MRRIRRTLDWLFKDLHGRKGRYVIAEAPNLPLLVFMASIILSVAIYPGPIQKLCTITAYLSMVIWGWRELRSGRSRFRRILGGMGLLSVATVIGIAVSI